MQLWQILITVFVSLAFGAVLALVLVKLLARQRQLDGQDVLEQAKNAFAGLSQEVLSRNTDELIKHAKAQGELAAKDLESKKSLIDQTLGQMTTRLEAVKTLMQSLETDRAQKFGKLAQHLQSTGQQTAELTRITDSLRKALAGSKTRGQWGERMAEDVLRLAGFVENVNYVKQKAIDTVGTRPDFTFLLPRGLKVNMDVKFPLDNYVRYLQAESETDQQRFRASFLADVKNQVKSLLGRDYINPQQNTVDYVLMFIPNEQVYAFIQEQDQSIVDEALTRKVVFCSPLTLFAILAVIRQAVDNFALEQASNEILSLLGRFHRQWGLFKGGLEKMGQRIEQAQKEFRSLETTRTRQLERPLEEIERLRTERGLSAANDQPEPAPAEQLSSDRLD